MNNIDEIRGKFPDLTVIEVVGISKAGVSLWGFKRSLGAWPIVHAQSMKGFRGYVHMFGDYFVSPHPVFVPPNSNTHYCRAAAVLFREDG